MNLSDYISCYMLYYCLAIAMRIFQETYGTDKHYENYTYDYRTSANKSVRNFS